MAMEFHICGVCGRSNRLTRKICFSCGANVSTGIVPPEKLEEPGPPSESSSSEQDAGKGAVEAVTDTDNDRKRLLGIIGSIILIIAVFTPAFSFPIVGSINFFSIWKVTSTIVIALGIASLYLTLTRKYKGLWFTGLGSFALLAVCFIRLVIRFSQAKSEMASELGDNPFSGLADIALKSDQLQWGWAFLILGAGLITAAAMINGGGAERVLQTVKLHFLNNRVLAGIALLIKAIGHYPLWTVWVERNYRQNIKVRIVGVTLENADLVLAGELKNTGNKTLRKVDITIYYLNNDGEPVHEQSYPPASYMFLEGGPLKPGFVRRFGVDANDSPSEWQGKVRVKVTALEFEK